KGKKEQVAEEEENKKVIPKQKPVPKQQKKETPRPKRKPTKKRKKSAFTPPIAAVLSNLFPETPEDIILKILTKHGTDDVNNVIDQLIAYNDQQAHRKERLKKRQKNVKHKKEKKEKEKK